MSAFIARNTTLQQVTLNLQGSNAVTLMPVGSSDIKGPTDRATLLEGEEKSPDVENARAAGKIVLVPVGSAVSPVAAPPKSELSSAQDTTAPKPARRRASE